MTPTTKVSGHRTSSTSSKRRAAWSEAIRSRLKSERFSYGPTEIEKLDIYKTTRWNAPIRIFCTAARGAAGRPKTRPIRPRRSSPPALTTSRLISSR